MNSILPNLDYVSRWPAVDEYGFVPLPVPNRLHVPRQTAVSTPDIGPYQLQAGDAGDGSDGPPIPPEGGSINGNHPERSHPWELHLLQRAFVDAMNYFCGQPPEAAGILVGPVDDEPLVTRFIPDHIGRGSAVAFELHAPFLNHILQQLKPQGLTGKGLIHSHPTGVKCPSSGDLEYFRRLFARPGNAQATHLFVPIVCDGRLHPYVFTGESVVPATLVVV